MQLQDLLEQVRQRRKVVQVEKERITEQQRELEAQKVRNLLLLFRGIVQKYFGKVLDALNTEKSFEYQAKDLKCIFQVQHSIVTITMSERDVQGERVITISERIQGDHMKISVGISAVVAESYFSKLRTLQDSCGASWLYPDKALEFLQELIFDIYEEYDRLLPEFQAASAKLIQEKTTERLLAEYQRAIEEAAKKSDREIAALNSVIKTWEWPEGLRLKLYKITWQKHGFVDTQGKAHFDYEFGWSLSDLPRSFSGYFNLLPECNKLPREVKPGYPVTLECYHFTKNELPEELLEKTTQQLEVVKVYDCIWEQSSRVLPQFLPELQPELADNFVIEPAIATFDLDVPLKPCLEIRQALSNATSGDDSELF
jgi:hypothetical protein